MFDIHDDKIQQKLLDIKNVAFQMAVNIFQYLELPEPGVKLIHDPQPNHHQES